MSLIGDLTRADKFLEGNVKELEKKIIKNYQDALKAVRALIAETAYEKYGGSYNDLLKYDRLGTIEKELMGEIHKLTGKNATSLKAGLAAHFTDSFRYTSFAVENEIGIKIGLGAVNPKVIEKSVLNPLDRIGYLRRNKLNQAKMAQGIQETLTQGLIQGKSYTDVAKGIKGKMDIGASDALRIANTEMHRVQSEARQESFTDAFDKGVNANKRWISALDDTTRDAHAEVDGQEVGVNEPFIVSGEELMYPGDPRGSAGNVINCRCSHIIVIKGYEPEVRRARDDAEKSGKLIKYQNYDEWDKDR